MVRYERPSLATRCCLPLVRGLRRPFKPKIIRLFLAAIFWLLAFVWLVFCGIISTIIAPRDSAALPDILFDYVLRVHDDARKVYPLPEVFLYALLTSAIGRMIFHKDGVAIARRFATIAGCVSKYETYILRGLTLIATAFPPPSSKQCYSDNSSSNSDSNAWSMQWGVPFFTEACGDTMGHTVNVVLAALAWSQYTQQYRIISVLAWLTSIAAMLLFIVDRSHYTIDVLVSLFISVFCWKHYHMVLRLPTSSQNRVVRWMEKLDGVAVGDVIEREREVGPRTEGISLTTVVNEALGTPLAGPSKYKELKDDPVV